MDPPPLFQQYPSAIFEDFHYLTDPTVPTAYQDAWARRRNKAAYDASTPTQSPQWEISQLECEADIIRSWCEDNSMVLPARRIEYHFIRYFTFLFAWKTRKGSWGFIPEPWFQENVWCWIRSMREDRSGSCFFGNQNQGKSEFFCLMAVALGCLHPHSTNQIMMAPVKANGTIAIWGRFLEVAKKTAAECGAKVAALGASINFVESSTLVYFSAVRPGGFVQLKAASECGSIQGTKEREDGYLIHYLDEIGNDYPKGGADWLATIPNISSNNRYFCILSANPRNQVGGLDSEMEPMEGWSAQTEDDYFWRAGAHNINVYRRAGYQSPNFSPLVTYGGVTGTPIDEAASAVDPKDRRRGLHGPFPWLYNGRRESKLLQTTNGNRNDPRYKEQALGMMPAMNLTLRVITQDDVKGSGMDLPFIWVKAPKEESVKITSVAFLDPAKTAGGDRNVLTWVQAGFRNETEELIVPSIFIREQVELVPTGKLIVTPQWLMDCEHVRKKNSHNGTLGDPVPFTRELALMAAQRCLKWHVPFANFGFDDSLSGEITHAMGWAFGQQSLPLSFGGQASKRPIMPVKFIGEGKDRRKLLYCDIHKKHVSELYSRLSHWMRGGYLRMNQKAEDGKKPDRWIKEAIQRLCERHGETGWDVENKKSYKARKNQISPDFCDSLVGALHLVDLRGLVKVEVPVGEGDDDYGYGGRRERAVRDLTLSNFHAA